jgi:hypothetical protein
VKPSLFRIAGLLFAVAASLSLIRGADKTDVPSPPEIAPKHAPSWVNMIDQGALDPRLKGYKTPEGVKVEIVAENPVVVNPVALTFADDGTPYVLERRPSPGDELPEKKETFT